MPRKLLDYKVERNKNSLKFYEEGVYLGSISLKVLGGIIRHMKGIHPKQETTQEIRLESWPEEASLQPQGVNSPSPHDFR